MAFSRPIRWLLALFGEPGGSIPICRSDSSLQTSGLRFPEPEIVAVASPDRYFKALEKQNILIDPIKAQERNRGTGKSEIGDLGGQTTLDEELLDEVTMLVESPTALWVALKKNICSLPPEVLISVMKKHQRYFPVYDLNRQPDEILLLLCAMAISSISMWLRMEMNRLSMPVLRMQLSSSKKIYSHNLADYPPRFRNLTFQFKLGTMLDKTERIEVLRESDPILQPGRDERAVSPSCCPFV